MEPIDARVSDTSGANGAPILTAVTVMRDGTDYLMCPFFGKCDGFLVVDPATAKVRFVRNPECTAGAICRAIIASGVARLICGFVPEAECKALRTAGVDVRLGSCACEVEELVTEFDRLPKA